MAEGGARFLIITADDLGMVPERDEGIFEAFTAGAITTASLLVNGCTALAAAEKGKELGMPMGLHLNLSEGPTISPSNQVPSLVQSCKSWWPQVSQNGNLPASPRQSESQNGSSGSFHPEKELMELRGKEGLRQALKKGLISLEEIALEITAQINKFKELTGEIPTYFDGHQHVHVLPGVAAVAARVAKSFGIQYTRIPQEDDEWLAQVEPTSRRAFYSQITSQAKDAAVVYSEHGIRFPEQFLGLHLMGQDLTTAKLQERLQALKGVGEYMTHVGYPSKEGDDFSKSSDRKLELDILTGSQTKAIHKSLAIQLMDYKALGEVCKVQVYTSNQLENGYQAHPKGGGRHLLILSQMKAATGNCMTALRLKGIAEELEWKAMCRDISDFSEANDLQNFIKSNSIDAVLGVHLYRAGRLLIGLKLPYSMVIGGTDVNVFVDEADKLHSMQLAVITHPMAFSAYCPGALVRLRILILSRQVDGASGILSFNREMIARFRKVMSFSGPVFIMPQAHDISDSRPPADNATVCEGLGLPSDSAVFVLPCGIRSVKDPLFLVNAFRELHQRRPKVWLLIVGPPLDQKCMTDLARAIQGVSDPSQDVVDHTEPPAAKKPKAEDPMKVTGSGVMYLPPVSHDKLLDLMTVSQGVLNSSEAEGMCLSLLEGMALKVPVVARAVPGNLELIRHRETGFLYSSARECIQYLEEVLSAREMVKTITDRATVYLKEHHSAETEFRVLAQALGDLVTES